MNEKQIQEVMALVDKYAYQCVNLDDGKADELRAAIESALREQVREVPSVSDVLAAFPLFDEQGLDEDEHCCEWSLQQERKRLHAMLSAAPTQPAQPPEDLTRKCLPNGLRYKLPPLELTGHQVVQFADMVRAADSLDATWRLKELEPLSAYDKDGPCPGGVAVTTEGQPGYALLPTQPAQAHPDVLQACPLCEESFVRFHDCAEATQPAQAVTPKAIEDLANKFGWSLDQQEVDDLVRFVSEFIAQPAQAEQPDESYSTCAVADSNYAAGMVLGWNLCATGRRDEFSKIRESRMRSAAQAHKAAQAEQQEWRWVDQDGKAMTNWTTKNRPDYSTLCDEKGSMHVEVRGTQPAIPRHGFCDHPDDEAAERFCAAMKWKLAEARRKGRGGWETCSAEDLSRMLREHVEKGDPRDVANFCMFLWAKREPIAQVSQPKAAQQEPVMIYRGRCVIDCGEHGHHDVELLRMIPAGTLLYTAAPQREPMTFRELADATTEFAHVRSDYMIGIARAVERFHGITKKEVKT